MPTVSNFMTQLSSIISGLHFSRLSDGLTYNTHILQNIDYFLRAQLYIDILTQAADFQTKTMQCALMK